MDIVSGEILTKEGFKKGYIKFNKEVILEIGEGNPPQKSICEGLIVPSFINAHTHIGDSFIQEKGINLPKKIEDLVAPPNGLKHKLLRESSDEEIIEGMENSINLMLKSGIKYFYDFRESGILGISQLKAAIKLRKISSVILSRPDTFNYDKDELNILLKNSDGVAISSVSDWAYPELQKVAKETRNKNKIFALHGSERIRESIDDILDLKPNFLVHMIKATETDIVKVKENRIPIVICPRANSFYGLKPNYRLLKKIGVSLLLGTDNAMLNSPIILDEISYLKSATKEFSVMELLYMTTFGARKALNLECDILGPNSKAEFVVVDTKTLRPLYISV